MASMTTRDTVWIIFVRLSCALQTQQSNGQVPKKRRRRSLQSVLAAVIVSSINVETGKLFTDLLLITGPWIEREYWMHKHYMVLNTITYLSVVHASFVFQRRGAVS